MQTTKMQYCIFNMQFFFQVEELTKEIHNRKEKDTSSVEVQTEDCAAWSQAGRESGDCLNGHLEQYLSLKIL